MMIDIKFVNFPKPGGKYGQLFLRDGGVLMCPQNLLDQFRAGMQCDVLTADRTWFQGTPDEKLVTVVVRGPLQGPYQPVQGQAASQGGGGYVSRETSVRPNTGFQPRVVQGGAGRPQAPLIQDMPQSEQTRWNFIMGVTGRWGGSGKFSISEMALIGAQAAELYDRLNAAHRNPSPKPTAAPGWPDNPPPDRPGSVSYGGPPPQDPDDPGPVDPGMSG